MDYSNSDDSDEELGAYIYSISRTAQLREEAARNNRSSPNNNTKIARPKTKNPHEIENTTVPPASYLTASMPIVSNPKERTTSEYDNQGDEFVSLRVDRIRRNMLANSSHPSFNFSSTTINNNNNNMLRLSSKSSYNNISSEGSIASTSHDTIDGIHRGDESSRITKKRRSSVVDAASAFFNNFTLAASALESLGALPTNDKFSTLGSKSLHEAVVITTPHYGNQKDKLPIVTGDLFTQQDKGSINMGRCVQVKPKYGRKFCKVEGCTSYAQKKGVCCRHGASFTKKKCMTLGCTNQIVKSGLCVAHGANRKRKICSHNGCSTFAVKNNLCMRHGAKVVRKQCSQEGCSSYAQKGGVCKKHYPK